MNNAAAIANFVAAKNSRKKLLTPGPAALLPANIQHLGPFFGRGDDDYQQLQADVLGRLAKMSGHREVVSLQGSASLALEIAVRNFLYGRVAVINSGYYAQRLINFCRRQQQQGRIDSVDEVAAGELPESNNYHWLLACYVETSTALLIDVHQLAAWAQDSGVKIMLDATASIGLEQHHHLAEVIAYSSCKGLCGLTGASFIAFNDDPEVAEESFYLNLETHRQHRVTGPYHTLASLAGVLPHHRSYRQAIINSKQSFGKQFADAVVRPASDQPLLCTYIDCQLTSDDGSYVFYTPRSKLSGSIVCHLGEVYLAEKAKGEIYQGLRMV